MYGYINMFYAIFAKGNNFPTSYLLQWTMNPFKLGLAFKGKTLPFKSRPPLQKGVIMKF